MHSTMATSFQKLTAQLAEESRRREAEDDAAVEAERLARKKAMKKEVRVNFVRFFRCRPLLSTMHSL